jgi:hypothetical protein
MIKVEIAKIYKNILPSLLQNKCFACGITCKPVVCRLVEMDIDLDYQDSFPACSECSTKYRRLNGNPFKEGKTKINFLKEKALKSKTFSMFFFCLINRYMKILDEYYNPVENPYSLIPGIIIIQGENDGTMENGNETVDNSLVLSNKKSRNKKQNNDRTHRSNDF